MSKLRIQLAVAVVIGAVALAHTSMREAQSQASVAMTSTQELIAPALAAWIVQSRDAAFARGVEPIPASFAEEFAGYLPEQTLRTVRWRVDGETGLLGRVLFQPGSVRAVTLDNVILFANAEEAGNIKLWAHELRHVVQYREWGIDEFARRFVTDSRLIESEAREFRWSWMRATGRIPKI